MAKLNSLDIEKPASETKIVVAMSGGVDSSVVAALLKEQNYQVIGITMQLYDNSDSPYKAGSCCSGQDINDAKLVCKKLNIPHYILNYEQKFYENVISPFINDYISGTTPVPCIACNQTVKFNDLLKAAKQLGADALATGHYLKNCINTEFPEKRALYRPLDLDRDQSYFLFATTQEQINYLRFPLSDITKDQVRQIAQKFDLEVANKPDSQDICFVNKGNYTDLIKKAYPNANGGKKGDIIHIDGQILGQHEGIYNYTIGQRKGLKIAYKEPLYVIMLNAAKSQVIVGPKSAINSSKAILRDVNWLGDILPEHFTEDGLQIFAKVRSTRPPCPAILYYDKIKRVFSVTFPQGEESVAPGQACVFFATDESYARLLGGGFIEKCYKSKDIEEKLSKIIGS